MKKLQKAKLSTVEDAVDRKGVYVCPVTGAAIRLSLSGYFTVHQAGKVKMVPTIAEAWRII